jgi:hypothetical protein
MLITLMSMYRFTEIMSKQDDLPPPPPPSGGPSVKESASERADRLRREDIRKERARERERERRLEAKDAHGFKKSKLTRDRDRDVSEKMALGQVPQPFHSDQSCRVAQIGQIVEFLVVFFFEFFSCCLLEVVCEFKRSHYSSVIIGYEQSL